VTKFSLAFAGNYAHKRSNLLFGFVYVCMLVVVHMLLSAEMIYTNDPKAGNNVNFEAYNRLLGKNLAL